MPVAHLASDKYIYYEQHGRGSDLVLIGGFTSDHTIWSDMVDELAAIYRVLILDNPGVGQSYIPPSNYTVSEHAKDLQLLLNHLNIKSAHFFGHSMGGAVLMQLCLQNKALVKKALVCCSAAKFPETTRLQTQAVRYAIEHQFSEEYIELFLAPWLYGRTYLRQQQQKTCGNDSYEERKQAQPFDGFLAQYNELFSCDLTTQLKNIECECLVVAAEEDLLVPHYASKEIAASIPGSSFFLLSKGVGHMPNVEAPDELCQIAKEYFGA